MTVLNFHNLLVTIQNSTYILKYEPSSLRREASPLELVRGIFYWMNPKQRKIRSILSLF